MPGALGDTRCKLCSLQIHVIFAMCSAAQQAMPGHGMPPCSMCVCTGLAFGKGAGWSEACVCSCPRSSPSCRCRSWQAHACVYCYT